MIRVVLVDDEPPARVRMRQLLDAAGGVMVVGEAGSAVEARDIIRDTRPDLLFLDVEMPEVRGTALAASLPEPRPFIVFATAFETYALDAIAVDATEKIAELTPDLVLLDIQMPGASGLDAVRDAKPFADGTGEITLASGTTMVVARRRWRALLERLEA